MLKQSLETKVSTRCYNGPFVCVYICIYLAVNRQNCPFTSSGREDIAFFVRRNREKENEHIMWW